MISHIRTGDSGTAVTESDAQPVGLPAPPGRYGWATWVSAVLVVAANILAMTGYSVPFLGAAVGFWFLLVHPVYLLYTASVWRESEVAERLGYSLATVLLVLLLGGLGMNTVLPHLGVERPLDPVPIVILGDLITVSFYLLRRRYSARRTWAPQMKTMRPEEVRLLAGAAMSVVLAILGANRLNNGAGGQVSLMALAGMLVTIWFLLRWRERARDGMIIVVLYLLSLGLLLMTSLRGWSVTGHDIQTEYLVFQLTFARGHWDLATFHNAYNACLSITILPTEVAQVVHVDNPYVYKVFFQLIFAACPVLVYAISRRYWSRWVAILAVVYFMGFPTFFTDMPFLNRQEIAYIFACAGFLAVTNVRWTARRRRISLVAASAGVEVSHYSTMYLFLGTLLVAWLARHASVLMNRSWRRPTDRRGGTPWAVMARTLSIGSLLVVAAIAFLWGGLATQTEGVALSDAASAIGGFISHSDSVRSNDTSYGLLPGGSASPQAVLNQYRQATLKLRAGAPPLTYEPASVVTRYKTPVVITPVALPLTVGGRLLAAAHVPVSGLNALIREAAAKGEQLFVGIGLITIFFYRKHRQNIGHEFFCLCVGSIVMVAVITVLPSLSAEYGVLRAFQEALILIAPVLVVGSAIVFRPLGRQRAPRIVTAVCLLLFASTTGLMPQLLGGYPAQLTLNNTGQYYQIYYTHPQESAAVSWLADKPGADPDGVQAENFTDRFAFTSPSTITGQQYIADIYPTLVRRAGWVILGYSNAHAGQASVFYDGDLITYTYPLGFLSTTKNLVYTNGGSEIYR